MGAVLLERPTLDLNRGGFLAAWPHALKFLLFDAGFGRRAARIGAIESTGQDSSPIVAPTFPPISWASLSCMGACVSRRVANRIRTRARSKRR